MSTWQNRLSALPSLMMPCPCGGRMKIALGRPEVQYRDGIEDTTYRCSGCRIELIATHLMQIEGDLI
jgi:hypothetical protein